MVRRWSNFRNPWEREYAMRGALWRGQSSAAPLAQRVPQGTRVLELGCGDGKFLAGLVTAGLPPVGLDFSRRALRLARGRLDVPLVLADVRHLPFRSGSFPVVAARYVLGALLAGDRAKAAAEILRVVDRDGWVFMEEFAAGDFRHGKGTEVEPGTFERNRGILTHYFDREEGHGLFPGAEVAHVEAVESRQRTASGEAPRRRWRWLLRPHSSTVPKASRGFAAADG